MAFLLDTSILVRVANKADLQHRVAVQAVAKLHNRGESLYITPQVLVEFRNVATRPAANNGLGLTGPASESIAAVFESAFSLLKETPDLFSNWKAVVQTHAVVGKQVYDARLVAVCHVHQISHLLTFNVAHFARLGSGVPGVVVVSPESV
jgi:predicted nucleic acid-binding protein